jgi:hypothetical protein
MIGISITAGASGYDKSVIKLEIDNNWPQPQTHTVSAIGYIEGDSEYVDFLEVSGRSVSIQLFKPATSNSVAAYVLYGADKIYGGSGLTAPAQGPYEFAITTDPLSEGIWSPILSQPVINVVP